MTTVRESRKPKNRILKLMPAVLLCLVLLFNCFSAFISAIGMRSTLNWLPGAFMTVDSASMEPDLSIGDLIFVWRVPFDTLKVGDTVTTCSNGTYTTHRIVRMQDEKIVTKGLVNAIEDKPAGGTDYFAKMIFAIPGAGTAYSIISSGWVSVLCICLILALFFAGPAAAYLGKRTKKLRIGLVRICSALCAASFMLIPNTLTLAKFTGNVTAGKTAVAAEVNFGSNYLTENGNIYDIVGWDGSDYQILVKINNYSNILKLNEEGVNLHYTFEYEKIAEADGKTYPTGYKVEIHETNGTTIDSSGTAQSTLPAHYSLDPVAIVGSDGIQTGTRYGNYAIAGGAKTAHFFRVIVNARDGEGLSLSEGDKIRFRIKASSIPGDGYVTDLFAEFTMTVTTANEFIKSRSIEQGNGIALVKLNIKSATLLGLASEKIVIKWQKDLLYPNLYETNIWNLISNNLCTVSEDDGMMSFTMSATASMTFEFNKYTAHLDDTVHQRMRKVVEKDDEGKTVAEYIEIELNDTYDDYENAEETVVVTTGDEAGTTSEPVATTTEQVTSGEP